MNVRSSVHTVIILSILISTSVVTVQGAERTSAHISDTNQTSIYLAASTPEMENFTSCDQVSRSINELRQGVNRLTTVIAEEDRHIARLQQMLLTADENKIHTRTKLENRQKIRASSARVRLQLRRKLSRKSQTAVTMGCQP